MSIIGKLVEIVKLGHWLFGLVGILQVDGLIAGAPLSVVSTVLPMCVSIHGDAQKWIKMLGL